MRFDAKDEFYASIQPLAVCPEFADLAVDPDLLNLLGGYFIPQRIYADVLRTRRTEFAALTVIGAGEHEGAESIDL